MNLYRIPWRRRQYDGKSRSIKKQRPYFAFCLVIILIFELLFVFFMFERYIFEKYKKDSLMSQKHTYTLMLIIVCLDFSATVELAL